MEFKYLNAIILANYMYVKGLIIMFAKIFILELNVIKLWLGVKVVIILVIDIIILILIVHSAELSHLLIKSIIKLKLFMVAIIYLISLYF